VPKKSLTELTLKSLRTPTHGQITYWDTQLTGFNIRLSPGGAKTFSVVVGPQRRRVTIGRYPLVPLAVARKRAREILLKATLNPHKRPSLSFEEAVRRYLHIKELEVRPSTFKQYKNIFDVHFHFGLTLIEDITTNDAANALDAIRGPSAKAHAYTVLKMLFTWCVSRELCEKNPLAPIAKPRIPPARERALDEDEIAAVWGATEDDTRYSLIVRLLVLTAQRANQIASLHEGWIDYNAKVINFPASIMKSNRSHPVPFGPVTELHLRKALPIHGYLFSPPGRAGQPFSGWCKCKRKLDLDCNIIEPWTLHDLRRTWATHSAQLGTDPHIIERVLAHATGSISKIAAIYNRYKYQDQVRAAIIRYENHIVQLCASKCTLTSPPLPFRFIPSA
jgi:integrase